MVLAVKVRKRHAERVREFMKQGDLFLAGYQYAKDAEFLWFPTKKEFSIDDDEVGPDLEFTFEKKALPVDEREPSWREAAKELLTPAQLKAGRFSYDTVGTIAIVEIVDELLGKQCALANLLLKINSSIKTVLKKGGGHEGEFRTQKMVYLAGEETRETMVAENNCRFLVNVETVYFSVRLSTERKRIASLIKPGERVLCMFSGAAPYPVVFARNTEAAELVGVEINPEGHKYGLENVKLNKVGKKVTLYCGDVNEVVPRLLVEGDEKEGGGLAGGRHFDRITMPLPHTGEEFLPLALQAAAPGATVHYYTFIHKDDFDAEKARVTKLLADAKVAGEIVAFTPCGQHAPRVFRVCIDIKVA